MTTNPAHPYRSMLNELHPLYMLLNDNQLDWVDRLLRVGDAEILRYAWYIQDLYRDFVETKQVWEEQL